VVVVEQTQNADVMVEIMNINGGISRNQDRERERERERERYPFLPIIV